MKNKFNRRKFIKTSLLGGLGVTALGGNALAISTRLICLNLFFIQCQHHCLPKMAKNCGLDLLVWACGAGVIWI